MPTCRAYGSVVCLARWSSDELCPELGAPLLVALSREETAADHKSVGTRVGDGSDIRNLHSSVNLNADAKASHRTRYVLDSAVCADTDNL